MASSAASAAAAAAAASASSISASSGRSFLPKDLRVARLGSRTQLAVARNRRPVVRAASSSLPSSSSSSSRKSELVVPSAVAPPSVDAAVAAPPAEGVGLAPADYEKLAADLEGASPLEIMDTALRMFGNDIAIAFSGAEDVALIEYAHLTGRPFRVFSLDTGRLNPETYRLFDAVEKRYNIRIEYTFPDAQEVQSLVRAKGLFSFYEDGHQECCRVRKVRPLRRALKGLRAWITGQRKDQSPGTRSSIPVVQVDPSFEGVEGGAGSLVKWNPVANVAGGDVWSFLRTMEVPVNELHSQGYVSIGCEPCTRPVLPGQHEREGRWWWEDAKAKECGLHKGNISSNGVGGDGGHEIVNGNGNGSAKVYGSVGEKDIFESQAIVNLSRPGIENLLRLDSRRQEPWLVVLYAPWCQFCQAMEPAFLELAHSLSASGDAIKVAKFRADGDHKEFAKRELQLGSFPTILFFPRHASRPIKYTSEKRDVDSLLAFIKTLR